MQSVVFALRVESSREVMFCGCSFVNGVYSIDATNGAYVIVFVVLEPILLYCMGRLERIDYKWSVYLRIIVHPGINGVCAL